MPVIHEIISKANSKDWTYEAQTDIYFVKWQERVFLPETSMRSICCEFHESHVDQTRPQPSGRWIALAWLQQGRAENKKLAIKSPINAFILIYQSREPNYTCLLPRTCISLRAVWSCSPSQWCTVTIRLSKYITLKQKVEQFVDKTENCN